MVTTFFQVLAGMVALSLNERMQKKLDYTQEETRVLRDYLERLTGTRRIPFPDAQCRRVAIAGKELTPSEREEVCDLVRPATLLGWFRKLVAKKYDSSDRRGPGRPRTPQEKRDLVIQMAGTNPSWGYTKIRDALRAVGVDTGRTTIADILKDAGLEPAPEREKKRTWGQFVHSQWESLYACDFFAVESLGAFCTVRYMVFFVMHVRTRTVEIARIRINPDGDWMLQLARNLTAQDEGFLCNAKYLICDRDPLFTDAFRALLKSSGVVLVQIPAKSPNCNPHAERFVRPIKYECLNHFVFFGERHLRHVIGEYMKHYLQERYHQGLAGKLISPLKAANSDGVDDRGGKVRCRQRLGGLLNYYYRDAA